MPALRYLCDEQQQFHTRQKVEWRSVRAYVELFSEILSGGKKAARRNVFSPFEVYQVKHGRKKAAWLKQRTEG